MNALKQKYHSLNEREQKLVGVAGIAIVIGLFYFLIWSPLSNGVIQQQQLMKNQQTLLAFVEDSAQRARQLRAIGGNGQGFRGSLPQAVNTTTNRHNIVISRMQPKGDEMQVWIDQAAFSDLIAWLGALERMGVVIQQADITEGDASGYIKVRRLELAKS